MPTLETTHNAKRLGTDREDRRKGKEADRSLRFIIQVHRFPRGFRKFDSRLVDILSVFLCPPAVDLCESSVLLLSNMLNYNSRSHSMYPYLCG